jgi:hypothetical protein
MMKKPPELYVISEPEAPAASNVLHLSGIRSHHGPADPRPVAPPWPPQVPWEDFLHRWKGQFKPT